MVVIRPIPNVLFFVFRIINYSDLIRILIEKDYIYNPMSITIIILTILNYVWFYKIYKIKTSVQRYYDEQIKNSSIKKSDKQE